VVSSAAGGVEVETRVTADAQFVVLRYSVIAAIDGVRVWARSDLDICARAHGTSCNTAYYR